jgi:hypothetical protein
VLFSFFRPPSNTIKLAEYCSPLRLIKLTGAPPCGRSPHCAIGNSGIASDIERWQDGFTASIVVDYRAPPVGVRNNVDNFSHGALPQ